MARTALGQLRRVLHQQLRPGKSGPVLGTGTTLLGAPSLAWLWGPAGSGPGLSTNSCAGPSGAEVTLPPSAQRTPAPLVTKPGRSDSSEPPSRNPSRNFCWAPAPPPSRCLRLLWHHHLLPTSNQRLQRPSR